MQVVTSNGNEVAVKSEDKTEIIYFIVVFVAYDVAMNNGQITNKVATAIGPWAVEAVEWVEAISVNVRWIIEKISKFICEKIWMLDKKHEFVKTLINGGIANIWVSCHLFLF